jgi:hypothetical protein
MCTSHQAAGWIARRFAILVFLLASFAVVPPSALADGDPTADQYDSTLEQISAGGTGGASGGTTGTESAPAAATDSSQVVSGLPFTGLDVVALAVVAIALCAVGLALHRRGRRLSETAGG